MKKYIILVILSFLALIFPKTVFAEEKVNKFGIHVLDPSDLPKAQELVNSSGGDWGWVTVVIRDDDLSFDKWQAFMNECRERHLVPLVRIATHLEGPNWVKPKVEDADKWANFLNSLNWPEKDRYVILFNEPNHTKEWGGEVNPKEYAKILEEFSNKFHSLNTNFLILNSGFDLAAPNGKETMEAGSFMQQNNFEVPGVFEKIDGWTSHSYPNHGYLGKPWESGKTSIRGYEWELNLLKNAFKVQKDLPVFITETGWPKTTLGLKKYYDEKTVADFFKYAFENVWLKDERVKAVTPFVLNYPQELFDEFSWYNKEGQPYSQCETVKNITKINWWPEQEKKYELVSILLPPFLPANNKFNGKLTLKNVGQSILGEQGCTEIPVVTSPDLNVSALSLRNDQKVKPGEIVTLDFSITASSKSGEYVFNWESLPTQKIKVFPASILSQTRYNFWEKVTRKLRTIFSRP